MDDNTKHIFSTFSKQQDISESLGQSNEVLYL